MSMMRTTHTYVTLAVSLAAYREIADKLKVAGYDHVFQQEAGEPVLDMHHLALTIERDSIPSTALGNAGEKFEDATYPKRPWLQVARAQAGAFTVIEFAAELIKARLVEPTELDAAQWRKLRKFLLLLERKGVLQRVARGKYQRADA